MRVAMYYNNHDIRIEEMPVPKIGAGELLVKVIASGICGSDVLEWYRVKKAPKVLGHEITGEIVETGAGVTRFKAGDRVFVSHHVPCNTCWYCLHGNHTVCETLHTTNFDPGGFAEYLRAPQINVDRGTFLLPEEVSFEEGAFIEPLACVVRGQRLARFRPGQTVAVMGAGISGMLHIMLARAMGAGRLIATDISAYRLDRARSFGADVAIDAREDVPARVRGANGGRLADLVIVCTGAMVAFRQALRSVDRGGTVLCFATSDPGVELPIPINDFWRNGITVMPSYANSPYDAEVAIQLLRARRLPVADMITHRIGLAETGMGFQLVAAGGDSLKVIVEPQR
ncbi:MAG TPA: zinc-dependent dehydrogenase [Candidatus Hydrogenedentes bacterium]|nr:zinc-dependent dehydrogenase [Candidatus Hydrogenedentota bacterium]HOV74109.1 zinc-dependent dehydrogenase [Candidatus Hydrogenedentota bacterium]HPC15905.1 zinc-dependent dehydrogenase [Candidatus Hydrogenedentota bacterium]HRT19859.1 zinc-dependent dehydrogenase [Candidatus Hydrogenedentota bacterium]HRT65439.1 zinc-dependent dehydrogenase [Candidatus Hydrogenedentota bacterium]